MTRRNVRMDDEETQRRERSVIEDTEKGKWSTGGREISGG
jgi:hypothetical protein